ncbi:hypothetical protein NEF87_004325 [Candidatus Lokiarchaeum ossiferum]|uniref:Class I SAM-dependent methyltransferase n=2 Tax=Candidatus Lokiarchaeum ossiferum TaxID=2951803 RepID=A0ABY6HWZ0_9ARCH|nr:hypothetical protein NEF87_004325 [Candidatus Lokiarchaeum sp. B-35]
MKNQSALKRLIINLKYNGIKITFQKMIFFSFLGVGRLFRSNFPISRLIKKYKKIMADVDSIEEIYDNVCQIKYLNVDIKPLQVRKEILALLQKVKDIKPKIIVEIGTNKGGTLALYTNVSQSDTKLISLDLPSGQFGGGYPEWKIPLYKSFARENQQIKLIRADSHELESLEILKNELNGQEIDFLFIDGDHTYEGIKQDFEMYSPLVRSKGMIAFHDIVVHENIDEVNVFQFWNEIKENYEYIENVEDWDQKSCGIGIIIKP